MKIIQQITNYINDNKFKILYVNNNLNVVNYHKIIEIKDDIITIETNKLILIKGHNLKINKLLDNEILITCIIKEIDL